jgi:hypothetical protein
MSSDIALGRLLDCYQHTAALAQDRLARQTQSRPAAATPTPTPTGSVWDEGHALAGLGRCAAAAGHTTRAEALLRQAHVIFRRIGAGDAPAVLNTLTSPEARE